MELELRVGHVAGIRDNRYPIGHIEVPIRVSQHGGAIMKLESTSHIDEIGKIHQWVEKRTHGAIRGLSVSIVDNVIVLSGRTTTYYSKQLATEAAKNTSGVLELSNEINVLTTN